MVGARPQSAWTSNPCRPGSLSLPSEGQTPQWTETIRTKVARGLLAALRDFGILTGAVRKEFAPPSLSIAGFGYVAFRLHEDGASSRALFASPVWRRWLLDPARVTELFHEAERQGLLRYSSAGQRRAGRLAAGHVVGGGLCRCVRTCAGIGQRIVDFHERGGEPPYLLYVYPPSDEWVVRRDLKDLQLWLEAPDQGVRCAAISLADLFWQALEAEGWIDELVESGARRCRRRDRAA